MPALDSPAVAAGQPTEAEVVGLPPLLQPSDLVYEGYFDVQTDGQNTPYSSGLAVRRAGDEVRLITLHIENKTFAEFTLAGKVPAKAGSSSSNQVTSTSITRRWLTTGQSIRWHQRKALRWDESSNRLWMVSAIDYPDDAADVSTNVYTFALVDDGLNGRVGDVKRVSLEGVPDRRASTAVFDIPDGLRRRWSLPAYGIGAGSYQSRMAQMGSAAMGPSLYAMPDPTPLTNGSVVPRNQFRVLAARGHEPRGRRMSIPQNYYDGGGVGLPRSPAPSGRPTVDPNANGSWLSPGADGLGYWTWDDGYVGAFFVDSGAKRGLVLVGVFMTGKTWYHNSQTNADGSVAEIHIFDPEDVGRISAGLRSAQLDPVSRNMRILNETQINRIQNAPMDGVAYDKVDRRLYISRSGMGPDGYWNRLFVYSINA